MKQIKIFHNPSCSKSRETLKLLEGKSVPVEIFLYLDNEITYEEFTKILSLLKMKPRDILRKKEKEYKLNNLRNRDLSDTELIEIILKNKKLIERPIVINGRKALIARPPEKVFEIL